MSYHGYPRRGGYDLPRPPPQPHHTHEGSGGHGSLPRKKTRIVDLPGGFIWTGGTKYSYPKNSVIEFKGRACVVLSGCTVHLKSKYDHRLPNRPFGEDSFAVIMDTATMIAPSGENITVSEVPTIKHRSLNLLPGTAIVSGNSLTLPAPLEASITLRDSFHIASGMCTGSSQLKLAGPMFLPTTKCYIGSNLSFGHVQMLPGIINLPMGLSLTAPTTLGGEMILAQNMSTRSAIVLGGEMMTMCSLSLEMEVVTEQQEGETMDVESSKKEFAPFSMIPYGTTLPRKTYLPSGTTLPKGTKLLEGEIIPAGTEIPQDTILGPNTYIPGGTSLPRNLVLPLGTVLPYLVRQ